MFKLSKTVLLHGLCKGKVSSFSSPVLPISLYCCMSTNVTEILNKMSKTEHLLDEKANMHSVR